jgi:hypothetical protein
MVMNIDLIVYILCGVIVFITLFMLWIGFKLISLRKMYKKMMNGPQVGDVEQVIIGLQNHIKQLQHVQQQHNIRLEELNQKWRKTKGQVNIIRYNAFEDYGSDLSFSISILDDDQDGVMITGIHNRDDTRMYAKPINKGDSIYALSPEEKKTIQRTSDSTAVSER